MRRLHWIPVSMLLVATVLVTACDSGNPVAPPGTILIVTASPSRISLNGQAQIIVEGRRPDGNPLPQGTEIRFSTSLGSISPIITEVGSNGRATAILRADGRAGEATVTVTTGVGGGGGGGGDGEGGSSAGGGIATTTVAVLIGESPDTAPTVRIVANPDDIPVGDENTATVTVIARNSDGSPVEAGLTVILQTTLGTLDPQRPLTDSDGTAISTLTAGDVAGTAEITATVGASEVATTTINIREAATDISLQASSQTVSKATGTESPIELTAFVVNSQGQPLQQAPVTFQAEVGSLGTNGVVFAESTGVARNTLTVSVNVLGNLIVGDTFTVRASTPSGSGELISDTITIQVVQ